MRKPREIAVRLLKVRERVIIALLFLAYYRF